MAIKLRKQIIPSGNPGQEERYFLRHCNNEVIDMNEICSIINGRCSVTAADVVAVMSSFKELLAQSLAHGRSLRFGEIGTLKPVYAATHPYDREMRFSSESVRLKKVVLQLNTRFKKQIAASLVIDEKQSVNRFCPYTGEERRGRILEQLSLHPEVVSTAFIAHNRCSKQTVLNDMRRLIDEGLVLRIRRGGGTWYVKA